MSKGSAGMWMKMLGTGIVLCVGGPALVQSVRPSQEELFKRYNPELQKRSIEQGGKVAQEFDDYVNRLKQWSRSDKSSAYIRIILDIVWFAAKEQEQERRSSPDSQIRNKANEEAQLQREEMRKELLGK